MPFVKDGVAYIPLQVQKAKRRWFALVDVEDMARVSAFKWMGYRSGRTIYARATSGNGLAQHHEDLSNFIMRSQPGERFDHASGNGLDNRKANLRLATQAQNSRNTLKTNSPHVTSRFKGVMLTGAGRWSASITFEGSVSVLGTFDDEADAARAYDAAAIRLFGEFAKTNAMMGLFENAQLVRDLSGWSVPDVRDLGEYVPSRNDRRSRKRIIGLVRDRRTKILMYKLADGTTVSRQRYIGTPPSEEDMARFAAQLREYEASKKAAKVHAGLIAL